MSKSINPFKIWGSYVLAVPLLIWSLILKGHLMCISAGGFGGCTPLWMTPIAIIIAFMFGWGIHLLFRRL